MSWTNEWKAWEGLLKNVGKGYVDGFDAMQVGKFGRSVATFPVVVRKPAALHLGVGGLITKTGIDGGFELAPDVEETAVINKLAPEKLARLHVNAAEALLAHYNDTLENHLFRIATHFKAAGDDMRACDSRLASFAMNAPPSLPPSLRNFC